MNAKQNTRIWTLSVFVMAFWVACESKKSDTLAQESPVQSAVDSLAVDKKCLKIDTAAWENFSKHWVYMSRTKNGYVVYDPCDGQNPTIDIDNFRIRINTGLEETINEKMITGTMRASPTPPNAIGFLSN